jgi:hypothetical protein
MPFKLKDISKIGGLFNRGGNRRDIALKQPDSKKRASYAIKQQAKPFVRYNIEDINSAKTMATNPDRPDRTRLLSIYRYIMTDAHLSSQISVAIMKVLSEPCSLYGKAGINKEASKLLQQPWFNSLITHILEPEFWGYSLVELIPDPSSMSAEITLIPREHVSPERHQVLIEGTLDGPVLPYQDVAEKINLLEFIHTDPLGLLLKAAPNVIFKFYARSDWSRASEKFGMPMLHLKIDTNDENELDEAERKAASFGSDGYIVTQAGDEATIIERKGEKMHDIYLQNINYCDDQLSKLINGQTAASDQKSFVGAAEVQERILNDYTVARLRAVKYAINFKVIPYLISQGFGFLNGLEFDYEQFRKQPKTEDPQEPTPPAQKKKLNNSLELARTDDITSLIATEIFKKHGLSRETDRELFADTYSQLKKAVEEGYGKPAFKTGFGTPNQEMLKNLSYNVGVFAAFKNHALSKDLVMALKDEEGNQKSYYQFKKDAAGIIGDYNQLYLQNEHNAAVSNARAASNWQKAVETKDLYPNLEYLPSRSANPRDSHRALWGTIRPMDDPFWNDHLPPSDWGCECGFRPTDKNATALPEVMPTVKPEFANNPGKTGKVFNDEHPYFKESGPEFKRVAEEAKRALFSYTLDDIRSWSSSILKQTPEGKRKIVNLKDDTGSLKAVINRKSFEEIFHHHKESSEYWDRINALYHIEEIVKSARYLHDETPVHSKGNVKRFLLYRATIQERILDLKFRETTDGIYFYYMRVIK